LGRSRHTSYIRVDRQPLQTAGSQPLSRGGLINKSFRYIAWFCLTILAAALAIIGCTSSKLYLLPNDTQEYRVFGYHFLKVLITNTVYDSKGWTYQLYISQEYRPPHEQNFVPDTVGVLNLDSLCVRFKCAPDTLCPTIQEVREPRGPIYHDGIVFGPAFDWGIITIPAGCDSITVNFVAVLQDRNTGEERGRQPVDLHLEQAKKRVGTFLR
jgi:hypothetical protein